jgi:hypothetical protein
MNNIIEELKGKVKTHPHNMRLEDTITHLIDLQRSGTPQSTSWDVIRRDFDLLEAQGLLENSDKVLNELRSSMEDLGDSSNSRMETHPKANDITVVVPPDSTNSSLFKSFDTLLLPQELVDILNHTYFLHILATEPTKVLSPGKSLISVLSRPHSANGRIEGSSPSLHDKVEDMVHKAFWNEVCMTNQSSSFKCRTDNFTGRRIALKTRTIYPARAPQTPLQRS